MACLRLPLRAHPDDDAGERRSAASEAHYDRQCNQHLHVRTMMQQQVPKGLSPARGHPHMLPCMSASFDPGLPVTRLHNGSGCSVLAF